MAPYVISYDLGTGGIKTSLVSAEGKIVESTFMAYPTYHPQADWQEQAPEDWWNAIIQTTRLLLGKAGTSVAQNIIGLAISGHSLGVVPIGHDGKLLCGTTPLWNDQRALEQAETFFSQTDYQAWYMRTGNGFPPACYSVFKMMWYRQHEPELFAQTAKFLGTKDYCNYRFTGKMYTDHSYASGSGVYDLQKWAYDDALIQLSGIPSNLFPEPLPSDWIIGEITPEAAAETGLPAGIKVVAGGVDNSCMALGAKGICNGRTYTSLGSSAWIAHVSSTPILDTQNRTYVFAHVLPDMYASATCIFSAGTSLQWVRNTCCPDLIEREKETGIDAYEAMTRLAMQSPVGANGVLFNPSLAGGSMLEPVPYMSGAFSGLRLQHTRADLLRATLEGIALNLRIALDALRTHSPLTEDMLMVGGGAKNAFWMQLFANIYACTVETTSINQSAATLGAAALALNGLGVWNGYEAIDRLHTDVNRFVPSTAHTREYEQTILPRFNQLTTSIATQERQKQNSHE